LYSRTFSDLKGITSAMDTQISRVLAQGIADGKHPRDLAKLLTKTISGPMGDLGITDTLGRFIPAERRAKILARTEIIRAHHAATIQEYRNYEVEGVRVKAEWMTAGDGRVCGSCAALEGNVYSLDVIESKIPLHPQCRCIALPVDMTGKERRKEISVPPRKGDIRGLETFEKTNQIPMGALNDQTEDIYLTALVEDRGFDKLPKLVTRKQMDNLVSGGRKELFRTVETEAMAESTRTGRIFLGHRNTPEGGGIFTTPTKEVAERIKGVQLRMALDKNVRLINLRELDITRMREWEAIKVAVDRRYDEGLQRVARRMKRPGADVLKLTKALEKAGKDKALELDKLDRFYGSISRYGVFKDYDAIIDTEYQWVVLNRGKLSIQTQ